MKTPWPTETATKILKKIKPGKTIVLQTGYGPSGLPHIGTFGELARTEMVIKALKKINPEVKTRLICFSDDMDGLRKVPDNIPNKEQTSKYLGYALTSIPDPFKKHESYGHYMNTKLREFLDIFGFNYEFKSSTECYKSGIFDEYLLKVLKKYKEVMQVMLPTLGKERQTDYSPFMPVKNGRVLQTKIKEVLEKTIIYKDPDTGGLTETEVTGGKCKLQWKPDWGMRWAALGVDFEMHGKDLKPSAELSAKICKTIGGNKPELFVYELFLDHEGKKISKSKGNGITIEEWLKYAPQQSLAFFMYQNPQRAKRLHFDVIPKNVDDYIKSLQDLKSEELKNPISFIEENTQNHDCKISFSLLLNLASACNPENKDVLWGFIKLYDKDIDKYNNKFLYNLTEYALNYYNDFIKPNKQYKKPDQKEALAFTSLYQTLELCKKDKSEQELQQTVYDVGKANGYQDKISEWFGVIYQVLFGQSQGPRIGSFIKLYGIENTVKMIKSKIA